MGLRLAVAAVASLAAMSGLAGVAMPAAEATAASFSAPFSDATATPQCAAAAPGCESTASADRFAGTMTGTVKLNTTYASPRQTLQGGFASTITQVHEIIEPIGAVDYSADLTLLEWNASHNTASNSWPAGELDVYLTAKHRGCDCTASGYAVSRADPATWTPWSPPERTATTRMSSKIGGRMPAGLVDLTLTVSVRATITTNNYQTASGQLDLSGGFRLDNLSASPVDVFSPRLDQPTDRSAWTSSPVFAGEAMPGSTVTVARFEWGQWHDVATGTTDAQSRYSVSTSLPDGSHKVTVRSTAADGIVRWNTRAAVISIDSVPPPPPVVTRPTDGGYVSGLARFEGTSRDQCSYNHTFKAYVDGTLVNQVLHRKYTFQGPDCAAPWEMNVGFGTGSHRVEVVEVDDHGNISLPTVLTVTMDGQRPTMTVDSLPVRPLEPWIEGTASDDIGITHVRISWTRSISFSPPHITYATCDGCGPGMTGRWRAEQPNLAGSGPITIQARAVDLAGNVSDPMVEKTFVFLP